MRTRAGAPGRSSTPARRVLLLVAVCWGSLSGSRANPTAGEPAEALGYDAAPQPRLPARQEPGLPVPLPANFDRAGYRKRLHMQRTSGLHRGRGRSSRPQARPRALIRQVRPLPEGEERAKPVMFVHVSASGGTALCGAAREELRLRVAEGINCNAKCTLPWNWKRFCGHGAYTDCQAVRCIPSWFDGREKAGCRRMAKYASRMGVEFIGRETLLEEIMPERDFQPCPQFEYVLLLRSPRTRLLSNLLRNRPIMANWGEHLDRLVGEWGEAAKFAEYTGNVVGTPYLDNNVIRTLLGPEVYFLPPGGVNATHLALAQRLLDQFALVLPLEETATEKAVLALMDKLQGAEERDSDEVVYQQLLSRMKGDPVKGHANHQERGNLTEAMESQVQQTLMDWSQYDLQLYDTWLSKWRALPMPSRPTG